MSKILTRHLKCLTTVLISLLVQFCSGDYTGKVLLVGFDGFRWDYMSYTDTPNLDRFANEGTTVTHVNNVFTSITFPSMYSIVTGLYPESHGIVGYEMYDPVFDSTWNVSVTEPRWYEDGEPIWVTARKHGLRSASYMWFASEVRIHGYRPNYWRPYNESHSFEDRVEEVIRWFKDDDINVVTLYFHEPDTIGHNSGPAPESPETISMIEEVDRLTGYIMDRFEDNGLTDSVNILITSDHGMGHASLAENVVELHKFVPKEDIQLIADEGAVANILPAEGKTDDVFNALNGAHSSITVYYKEDLPARWHFTNHRRILPIVVVADESWLALWNASTWDEPLKGMHGYDNELMNMKPFFLARGPNIKQGFQSEPFEQVDIYPLMCELLGVTPSDNNGSLEIVGEMLQQSPTGLCIFNHVNGGLTTVPSYTGVVVMLCVVINYLC